MGVCARDDRKSVTSNTGQTQVLTSTMVGIRASEDSKTKRHEEDDTSSTRVEQTNNPSKKIKLLDQIKDDDILEKRSMNSEIEPEEEDDDEENDGEDRLDDAEPIGDVVRVSSEGGENRRHFRAFKFDGNVFHLEDIVLVTPEEGKVKPSVAIIKEIFQTEGGWLMVCGQRLYRPEEAVKKEGGTWQSRDARELFYSRHLDELYASNVMHKCMVHLVPMGKSLPNRKQQPGFIIQKVYDFEKQKLRILTDKDCRDALPQLAAA